MEICFLFSHRAPAHQSLHSLPLPIQRRDKVCTMCQRIVKAENPETSQPSSTNAFVCFSQFFSIGFAFNFQRFTVANHFKSYSKWIELNHFIHCGWRLKGFWGFEWSVVMSGANTIWLTSFNVHHIPCQRQFQIRPLTTNLIVALSQSGWVDVK